MNDDVLSLLKDRVDYLSGEAISRLLGVSRTAVWKTVGKLRQSGYTIAAVPNRGYRLIGHPDILSESEITAMLKNNHLDSRFLKTCYMSQTDSTNLVARRAAESGAPDGSLYVAGQQTAGRGRNGRVWSSQADQDLTFSILLRPRDEPAALTGTTLLAGLCTATAINDMIGLTTPATGPAESTSCRAGIKWPNDLVFAGSGRKIGGILTESMIEDNRVQALVIGIGINVNTEVFPEPLVSVASSLRQGLGQPINRLDLLRLILQAFSRRLDHMTDIGGWLPEYRRLCLTLGREVKVIASNGTTQVGRAVDLDAAGELIIEDGAGKTQIVRSGEVSVRGLLGYT